MEECAICLVPKCLVTLGCSHRFCADCLLRQLRFQARCAICRCTLTEATPPLFRPSHKLMCLTLTCGEEDTLGIAVTTTAKGVMVANVMRGASADHCGFRVGDTIVAVNHFPCLVQKVAVQLLSAPGDVQVHVARTPSPPTSRSLLQRCCPRSRLPHAN